MFELMDSYSQAPSSRCWAWAAAGGNAVSHMVQAGLEGVDFHMHQHRRAGAEALQGAHRFADRCNITKGLGAGGRPGSGAGRRRWKTVTASSNSSKLRHAVHHRRHGRRNRHGRRSRGGATSCPRSSGSDRGRGDQALRNGRQQALARRRPRHAGVVEVCGLADHDSESEIAVGTRQFHHAARCLQGGKHRTAGAVQGIAELITRPGLINVDFADVRTVMSETGMAMMGSGTASGDDRAREAAEAAISSSVARGHQSVGRSGDLGQCHRGYGPVDRRVPRGWQRHQAVRFRRCDGGRGYGHRCRDGEPNPRNGRGDRIGQACCEGRAAAGGRRGSSCTAAHHAGHPAAIADGARPTTRCWTSPPCSGNAR